MVAGAGHKGGGRNSEEKRTASVQRERCAAARNQRAANDAVRHKKRRGIPAKRLDGRTIRSTWCDH